MWTLIFWLHSLWNILMAKLTLNTIGSRYGSIDALNNNSDSIEAAFENTLSRDGTAPNNMEANLDMDSHRVINILDGVNNQDAATVRQVNSIVAAASSGLIASLKERQDASSGQTVFNLASIEYAPGSNNLAIYIDGVRQYPGESYTETDLNTVTFSAGLNLGAEVLFITNEAVDNANLQASAVHYTPAGTGAVTTTVQTKLHESVSVKDFGAVGDGVADDTVAIQAAVNAAKLVNFPAGVYLVSSSINLPNGTWLQGVGGFQNTATDRISKINFTGTSGWAFQFVSPANLTNFYGDFSVKGLMIDAQSIATANAGGCLLFGNLDTGNFGTYGFIGRVNIDQCWFTGHVIGIRLARHGFLPAIAVAKPVQAVVKILEGAVGEHTHGSLAQGGKTQHQQ